MMKFPLAILSTAMALSLAAGAQSAPQVIPLWSNGAPGFENRKDIPEASQGLLGAQ